MQIKQIMMNALVTAINRGKYQEQHTPEHIHALIHAEISEATNEIRLKMPPIYQECVYLKDGNCYNEDEYNCKIKNSCWIASDSALWSNDKKPLGEAVELADAIILICSYAAKNNIDLEKAIELKMKYDAKRSC